MEKLSQKEIDQIRSIPLNEYTLYDLQKSILSIMIRFDKICKDQNINYILDGGTMLGAIRHGGFIPWDDDIDVAMLRKDYNKFKRYCRKNPEECFCFIDTSTNKKWPYNFGKMKKNNTILEETFLGSLDVHQGVWIDIFPVDKTTNLFYKIQAKLSRFWQDVRWTKDKIKECSCFKPKHKKLLKVLSLLPYWLINFNANFSIRSLNIFPVKKVAKLCHPGMGKGPHSIDYYKDIVLTKFEENLFYIPKNYQTWLEQRYKNPMTLPPKNKRVPTHYSGNIKL